MFNNFSKGEKMSEESKAEKIEKGTYNVAFVYTAEAGGYEGVVTWTTFDSKEHFDEWFSNHQKITQRVVEEGISKERAIELVRQTPAACRIAAAMENGKNKDPFIQEMEIRNVELAILLDRQEA